MSITQHTRQIVLIAALLPLTACMMHSRSYFAVQGVNVRPQGEMCRAGAPANHYIPNGAVEFRVNLEPQFRATKQANLYLYAPNQAVLDSSQINVVFTPDNRAPITTTFTKVSSMPYEKAHYEELPRKFAPRTTTVHYFVADTLVELGQQGSMRVPSIQLSSLLTDEITVSYRRANFVGALPLNC